MLKRFSISSVRLYISALLFLSFNVQHFAQVDSSSLKNLSISSEIILHGKVSNIKSMWNNDKSAIISEIEVESKEFIKGEINTSNIKFNVMGGEVDGIGEVYSHLPKFRLNEEIILFMIKDENEIYRVNGGDNGKITIGMSSDKEFTTSQEIRVKNLSAAIKKINAELK